MQFISEIGDQMIFFKEYNNTTCCLITEDTLDTGSDTVANTITTAGQVLSAAKVRKTTYTRTHRVHLINLFRETTNKASQDKINCEFHLFTTSVTPVKQH